MIRGDHCGVLRIRVAGSLSSPWAKSRIEETKLRQYFEDMSPWIDRSINYSRGFRGQWLERHRGASATMLTWAGGSWPRACSCDCRRRFGTYCNANHFIDALMDLKDPLSWLALTVVAPMVCAALHFHPLIPSSMPMIHST